MREPADLAGIEAALAQAKLAANLDEVPVGAVVIRDGVVVSRAYNATIARNDPTAHAELLAIQQALTALGTDRLDDSTLYVTLEPCAMCSGAVVLARVPRLVFGAADPKGGFAGSLGNFVQDPRLNHRAEVRGGVLEGECARLLRDFFHDRR